MLTTQLPEGAGVVQTWPVIKSSSPNKLGKYEYWTIVVYTLGSRVFKETFWCQDGSKIQSAQVEITEGKNLGKANETTPIEQAVAEAFAQATLKKDKMCPTVKLPMLAQNFKDRKKYIKYPCHGQPKFDGHRLLMNSSLDPKAWSRSGKPYEFVIKGTTTPTIEHLMFDTQGYTIDGELMLPSKYPFQLLKSAVSGHADLAPYLEYHVYDVMIEDVPWGGRSKILHDISENFPNQVHRVINYTITCEDSAIALEQSMVEKGYEGLILRNLDGLYTVGERSNDLQKLKSFDDAEFKVVNVIDGKGKESGAAIFICETKEGETFEVRPCGTYETRKEWFNNKEEFINKWLTVKYFGVSIDKIPRFPVGIEFREMKDGKVVE